MNTRSRKINILPRIFTKSVNSLSFAKSPDSSNDIICLIQEASQILSTNDSCILSMVIPDSYYSSGKGAGKGKGKIHQAHTFAVSRNSTGLIVYDISVGLRYKSTQKCWDNYRDVINSLAEHRRLQFFPLIYAKANQFRSIIPRTNPEGSCFEYIEELEQQNIIHPMRS